MALLDKLLNKKEEKEVRHEDERSAIAANQEKFSHYGDDGKLVYWHIDTFDENGRLIHKTAYKADGSQMGDYDIVYNEHGDEIESCWYFFGSGYLMKQVTEYDEKNRKILADSYPDEQRNVLGHKIFYFYDENDRIEHLEEYSYDSRYQGKRAYRYLQYDEAGNRVREETYDQEKTFVGAYDYEYDEKGNRIKEISYNSDQKVEFYNIIDYDNDGKVTETRRYDPQGNLKSVEQ